jgi:hypothetical protein
LSDGGVYDNLGMQPIEQYHTLLVSDGGGPFKYDPSVSTNWFLHVIRAWKVTDNQVRGLRRSAFIDELKADERRGAFWGIQTRYSDYPAHSLAVDDNWAKTLMMTSTRLWRIKTNAHLPREQQLADGSYLSRIYRTQSDRRHQRNAVTVRVIEYRLQGVSDAEPIYRLLTTLLDPEAAPATELAALYHERWEIETALAELKTHLRGAKIVLRSKTPDLARQEFYGLMMAHFAVRGLMHEAALKADTDPDQLSFLHAVRVIRRKLAAFNAIPPSAAQKLS